MFVFPTLHTMLYRLYNATGRLMDQFEKYCPKVTEIADDILIKRYSGVFSFPQIMDMAE
jgi:hypothetical protein